MFELFHVLFLSLASFSPASSPENDGCAKVVSVVEKSSMKRYVFGWSIKGINTLISVCSFLPAPFLIRVSLEATLVTSLDSSDKLSTWFFTFSLY